MKLQLSREDLKAILNRNQGNTDIARVVAALVELQAYYQNMTRCAGSGRLAFRPNYISGLSRCPVCDNEVQILEERDDFGRELAAPRLANHPATQGQMVRPV